MREEKEKARRECTMPKRATAMVFTEEEREELEQRIRCHRSEQHAVQRAQIVLAADQGLSHA